MIYNHRTYTMLILIFTRLNSVDGCSFTDKYREPESTSNDDFVDYLFCWLGSIYISTGFSIN